MSAEREENATSRRSRRATTKIIDYAKEQEFSDEDLFEDVPQKDPPVVVSTASKKRKTKGNRKLKSKKQKRQDAETSLDPFEDDAMEEYIPSKPIYTEKGYDPTLPPIRERFPFLPEFELDGSPRIELIVGRRPVDEKDENKEGSKEDDSDDDGGNFKSATYDENDEGGRQRKDRRGNDETNNGVKKRSGKKKVSKKDLENDFVE